MPRGAGLGILPLGPVFSLGCETWSGAGKGAARTGSEAMSGVPKASCLTCTALHHVLLSSCVLRTLLLKLGSRQGGARDQLPGCTRLAGATLAGASFNTRLSTAYNCSQQVRSFEDPAHRFRPSPRRL